MSISRIVNNILGYPFVYERIRPLAVGGIDYSPLYLRLGARASDVILDIGCGTGDALRYLTVFSQYVGFDLDEAAIDYAKEKYRDRERVTFHARSCDPEDLKKYSPSLVVMAGLLHHLTNREAIELLRAIRAVSGLRRIVTLDIVYLPKERVSNFYARLDRGKYCRTISGYRDLAFPAELKIEEEVIIRSHPTRGLAKYFIMVLSPA
jgi:SAM-dependent methyltransferase